jgi:hypothetical protein
MNVRRFKDITSPSCLNRRRVHLKDRTTRGKPVRSRPEHRAAAVGLPYNNQKEEDMYIGLGGLLLLIILLVVIF